VVYRYSGYYAVKQQNVNSEFLFCSENRNGIVFTFVGDISSQLRSLRVNRERTLVISVKYIAETATLPEIEDFVDPRAHARAYARIYLHL
jgi:hypothetical protein